MRKEEKETKAFLLAVPCTSSVIIFVMYISASESIQKMMIGSCLVLLKTLAIGFLVGVVFYQVYRIIDYIIKK